MKKTVLLLFLAVSMVVSAQMIGATNSQGTFRPAGDSPLIRPTGPSLRFGAGNSMVSVAFDYQFTPWLLAGGGVGYGRVWMYGYTEHFHRETTSSPWVSSYKEVDNGYGKKGLPLFLEGEVRTPGYKWSLFLNMKVGLTFPLEEVDSAYDGRNDAYAQYDVVAREYKYSLFRIELLAGFGYKNLSMGIGYTNSCDLAGNDDGFIMSFSYNLPITTLRKWLVF